MKLRPNAKLFHCFMVFPVGACIIALFCLSVSANASPKKVYKGHPALWQIKGKKIPSKNKIYLFGSYEPLPDNYSWYNGKIKEAFEQSDELILEVILTPNSGQETTRIVNKYGLLKNRKKNLSKLLDGAHYKKMVAYSKTLMKGTERAVIKLFKPWVVTHQFAVRRSIEVGMDLDYSSVRVLREKAIAKKIPVIGLDTLKDVWDTFLGLEMDLQVKLLKETLDQMDDYYKVLIRYINAWGSGDEKRITDVFIGEMNKYEGLSEVMILDRNHYWMPVLEKHFRSGKNIFISVNITNLVGPYSLIRILEDEGYKITKVQ